MIAVDLPPALRPVSRRRVDGMRALLELVPEQQLAIAFEAQARELEEREQRRAAREAARGRIRARCSCGRFKSRPSSTCSYCGNNPVPLGYSDADHDRAYGWDA